MTAIRNRNRPHWSSGRLPDAETDRRGTGTRHGTKSPLGVKSSVQLGHHHGYQNKVKYPVLIYTPSYQKVKYLIKLHVTMILNSFEKKTLKFARSVPAILSWNPAVFWNTWNWQFLESGFFFQILGPSSNSAILQVPGTERRFFHSEVFSSTQCHEKREGSLVKKHPDDVIETISRVGSLSNPMINGNYHNSIVS